MGDLFSRYFQLLAGRLPGAEYGVIATPGDGDEVPALDSGLSRPVGLCCPRH